FPGRRRQSLRFACVGGNRRRRGARSVLRALVWLQPVSPPTAGQGGISWLPGRLNELVYFRQGRHAASARAQPSGREAEPSAPRGAGAAAGGLRAAGGPAG